MHAPNPSTALARVIVDELARHRVRHLVLAAGSRSAALALAAADRADFDLVVEIDERAAGFYALGVGKQSGSPAVVITTSGTAAANLYPAVVEADAAAAPLLVLTADRPPELRHTGANQTIDQIKLFGDRVRWFCELGVAESGPGANRYWRSTVSRAVAEAKGRSGRPGPVHLNLAFREPVVPLTDDGRVVAEEFGFPIEGRDGGAPWTAMTPAVAASCRLHPELAASKRGVVVVGSSRFAEAAADLAQMLGWPLLAEAVSGMRQGTAITTFHHLAGHGEFAERHHPEVVVSYGSAPLSPNLARMVSKSETRVMVGGWSDPDRTATHLFDLPPVPAEPREAGEWLAAWVDAEAVAREAIDRALDAEELVCEPRTARDTALAVPDTGTLVVGSSMPVRDLDWFMPNRPLKVVSNRGASGIDGFVSTMFGVAASSGGPTVGLAGDLSVLHDQSGFLLDRRPDCVLVVVNNDGGGIFSFLPPAGFPQHFERLFATPHGRDFSRLAALFDLDYRLVEEPADLIPAIRRPATGVRLLEVRTDRVENVAVHCRVTTAVDQALDDHLGISRAPSASPPA